MDLEFTSIKRVIMMLYQIKPTFRRMLRPLVRRLALQGMTANDVTLIAVTGSVAVGALAVALPWLPAVFLLIPLWLPARLALNAIDGMLAREHGQQSVLGAYLSELCDIVSDLVLILPFAAVHAFRASEVITFAVLAVVVECAGLIGPLAGASRRDDGPLGQGDRALVLGVLGLWVGLGRGVLPYAHVLWVLLSVLSVLTVIHRVRRGIDEALAKHAAGSLE
jgi:CDP-diacylglycerol--glycerol-3-phosphate 3-phosphatidyltransferase